MCVRYDNCFGCCTLRLSVESASCLSVSAVALSSLKSRGAEAESYGGSTVMDLERSGVRLFTSAP